MWTDISAIPGTLSGGRTFVFYQNFWNAIATQPIGLVPFQARGILLVAEEQSRTRRHCGSTSMSRAVA